MAKFNLNKTEKIKSKTTIAWKLISPGDHSQQKSKSPFSDQNLLSKNKIQSFFPLCTKAIWSGWFRSCYIIVCSICSTNLMLELLDFFQFYSNWHAVGFSSIFSSSTCLCYPQFKKFQNELIWILLELSFGSRFVFFFPYSAAQ